MSSVVVRKVLDLAPELMALIQKEYFRYYNETYADILKRPDFSGEPVLGLNTPERHFEKRRHLAGIALARNRSIELGFFHDVDEEHGLAIMFVNSVFYRVAACLTSRHPDRELLARRKDSINKIQRCQGQRRQPAGR